MTDNSNPKPDGRRARAERSRVKLLTATRTLMLAGALRPTATQICERADCSLRTLYEHYPTVTVLYENALYDQYVVANIVARVMSLGAHQIARAVVMGKVDFGKSASASLVRSRAGTV